MAGNHQTSIYKLLFGVPGIYIYIYWKKKLILGRVGDLRFFLGHPFFSKQGSSRDENDWYFFRICKNDEPKTEELKRVSCRTITRWWCSICFIFTPTRADDPI